MEAPSVRSNLIANFGGKVWAGALSIGLVPIYLRLLGPEAYGLVGVYATLLGVATLIDLGASTGINRELARLSSIPHSESRQRDVLFTAQTLYWGAALLVSVALFAAAPWIADRWLSASTIPRDVMLLALRQMSCLVSLQLITGFYSGGLLGRQQHVKLNLWAAFSATIRGVAAIVALRWIAPTIAVFFWSNLITGLVGTVGLAVLVWRTMPDSPRSAQFTLRQLAPMWRFMAGLSVTSLLGLAITQVDKLVLSGLLTLSAFGGYTVAASLAAGLQYLGNPVYTAFFPRFAQACSRGTGDLYEQYRRASQITAVAVLPVASVLAYHADSIALLWTGDVRLSVSLAPPLTILTAATALNIFASLPYGIQLAAGRTKTGMWANLVAAIAFLPLTLTLAVQFGAAGAAFGVAVTQLYYLVVHATVVNRGILPRGIGKWLLHDIAPAFVMSAVVCLSSRYLVSASSSKPALITVLGATHLVSTAMSAAALSRVRHPLFGLLLATIARVRPSTTPRRPA